MAVRHAYKELHLQQLRGFCETARLGSLAAAAEALGLAQPTVWEQVHSLEREFGARLVEPHGRGCRLTEAGRLLAQLAAPLVAGIDALKRRFAEAQTQRETWLTLATTQRVFVEDLPEVLTEFRQSHPLVRLRLHELRGDQVAEAVESGAADLGLTTQRTAHPPSPWMVFEPAYELEPILVAPKDHPLARKRQVRPLDLRDYPLVNSPVNGFADPSLQATLEKLGVFAGAPRPVEANYTSVLRRCVELGFGIALVPGVPGRVIKSPLHERSMRRHFGCVPVHLVWREGTFNDTLQAFAATVKARLGGRKGRDRGSQTLG